MHAQDEQAARNRIRSIAGGDYGHELASEISSDIWREIASGADGWSDQADAVYTEVIEILTEPAFVNRIIAAILAAEGQM